MKIRPAANFSFNLIANRLVNTQKSYNLKCFECHGERKNFFSVNYTKNGKFLLFACFVPIMLWKMLFHELISTERNFVVSKKAIKVEM